MILERLEKNRSFRRFDGKEQISKEAFSAMANAVRFSASAGNLQRLRLAFISEKETCDKIFATLAFAAYLKNWDGPSGAERPAGYAVILSEHKPDATLGIDIGIAAQSILLTAGDFDLGGCMFLSFKKDELSEILELGKLSPVLVIALGKPKESVRIVDAVDGEIKYYRDENDTHVVPKLTLSELVVKTVY